MRNPERWRNIALAWFLSGPFLVAAAWMLPAPLAGDGLRGTMACVGLMGILFGGFGALDSYQKLKAKRRLARGEGLLARWRIEPQAWRDFVALDRERNGAEERYPNEFSPRDDASAGGVDILVGEEAVEIDGSVHRLPRHGTPEILRHEFDEGRARPSVIELDLYYPGSDAGDSGSHGPTHTCLRFPVPPNSQAEARRIVAHYGQPRASFSHAPGDGSHPEGRRWSRRFGAVLVVLGSLLAVGMVTLIRVLSPTLLRAGEQVGPSRFTGGQGMAYLVLAILGAVLVFGATAAAYGSYQLVSGRRALWPVKILLWIFGALMVLGLVIGWL